MFASVAIAQDAKVRAGRVESETANGVQSDGAQSRIIWRTPEVRPRTWRNSANSIVPRRHPGCSHQRKRANNKQPPPEGRPLFKDDRPPPARAKVRCYPWQNIASVEVARLLLAQIVRAVLDGSARVRVVYHSRPKEAADERKRIETRFSERCMRSPNACDLAIARMISPPNCPERTIPQ